MRVVEAPKFADVLLGWPQWRLRDGRGDACRVLIFCCMCTKQASGAVHRVQSDHLQLLDQSFPTSRLPRPCWERCLGVLKRAFHRKLPPLLAGVAVSGEIGPFSGSFRHSKRLNTHAHPLQYSTRPQNDIQG